MKKNNPRLPILLTSSVIAYDATVRLTDTSQRIEHALESIGKWLEIDRDLKLVLCDGSNFDFSELVKQRFPSGNFECLPFENDQTLVRERGRGFGEGEIVKYSLNHSKFIRTAGAFTKCTSKLWVENYAECLRDWNGNLLLQGIFPNALSPFRKTNLAYIDTRFYIASITCYQRLFENAHTQIDTATGHGLEDCFKNIVREHDVQQFLMTVAPVICGVGGAIGKYYKKSMRRQLKEKARIFIAQRNASYKRLFIRRTE